MISIKKNPYTKDEKLALYVALHAAVTEFINHYCDPTAKCNTCEFRHVCYDLIAARDYTYKIATEDAAK